METKTPNTLTAPDLEEAILGALILEKDAILRLEPMLPQKAFTNQARQQIYQVIKHLFAQGEPIDILTVKNQLRKQKQLQSIGGAYYLTELTSRVASSSNLQYYARIILEKFIGRQIQQMAHHLQIRVQKSDEDIFELLDQTSHQLMEIEESITGKNSQSWEQLLIQSLEEIHQSHSPNTETINSAIFSGIPSLDNLTYGFKPGELNIIAARPAMGKSSFMRQIAKYAAQQDIPVLIFSPEMTAQQITQTMIIHEAQLDNTHVQTNQLSPKEIEYYEKAALNLNHLPIQIDDTGGLSLFELKARTTRWRLKFKESARALVCLDYIQLVKGSPKYAKSLQRHLELGEISRTLKELAKNLKLTFVALSQLSREVDKRPDPRPLLSDLRQSGNIEQDADKVIFLYRPAYYAQMQGRQAIDELGNDVSDLCILLLAKHRAGPTGETKLTWQPKWMGFYEGSVPF